MNVTQILLVDNIATWVFLSTQECFCVSFPFGVKYSFFFHKNQELFIASEQVLKDDPSLIPVSEQGADFYHLSSEITMPL